MHRRSALCSLFPFIFIALFSLHAHAAETETKPRADLSEQVTHLSWTILNDIISEIGARPAGSDQERKAIHQFARQYWGAYSSQPVPFTIKETSLSSSNAWITLPGAHKTDKHIIIGAHADSTGQNQGSQGATDNGVAMALLLALGDKLREKSLNYTVTLVLFGAEEVGHFGSKAFVQALQADSEFLTGAPSPVAMINLDTIAGGDHLYIHSPTQTPYQRCQDSDSFNASPAFRNTLLHTAQAMNLPFQLHPAFPGFAEGETGEWSDHVAFACAGIPIAYIEATNFGIKGQEGYDGYSQGLHPALWDCLQSEAKTACDPASEQRWGRIWHTRADQLSELETLYPGRLQTQLSAVTALLVAYLTGA